MVDFQPFLFTSEFGLPHLHAPALGCAAFAHDVELDNITEVAMIDPHELTTTVPTTASSLIERSNSTGE